MKRILLSVLIFLLVAIVLNALPWIFFRDFWVSQSLSSFALLPFLWGMVGGIIAGYVAVFFYIWKD